MPGKRQERGNFLTPFIFYREVSTADSTALADIDAIEPVIEMGSRVSDIVSNEQIYMGYDNILELGIAFGAGVTGLTVQVYSDITPTDRISIHGTPATALGVRKWALLAERELEQGAIVAIPDLPPSAAKIIISAISGTATTPIMINYARSE